MRRAIIAAVALGTLGCLSRQPAQVAAVPTSAIRSDSVRTARIKDSVIFNEVRRTLAELDSMRAGRIASTPINDSLIFIRLQRSMAQLDSFVKKMKKPTETTPTKPPTAAAAQPVTN